MIPIDDFFEDEYDPEESHSKTTNSNPIDAQDLANALERVLTNLRERFPNMNAPLSNFNGSIHEDPVKWLDDYNRISMANGYDEEQKLTIVGAYLTDSAATWYLAQ